MLNQPSPRTIYFVVSILIIILAPIFIFIFPVFSVGTFHFDKGQIVLIPSVVNFNYVLIAFVALLGSALILAFKRNKMTYTLSGLLCISFFALMYISTISHTLIHSEYIVIQDVSKSEKYEWDEIADVLYEYEVGQPGTYYFRTKEGNEFSITENAQFGRKETKEIAHIINLNKINFEKKQLES